MERGLNAVEMRVKFGVLGAGAIGAYLGGRLAAAGEDVALVGRLGAEVREHGLTLTDLKGERVSLRPDEVVYRAEPQTLVDRDVVIVAVKSMDTEAAARPLTAILAKPTVVVSFQNGVANPETLRRTLPGHAVLAGMVPFNVLREPKAHFRLATSGPLALERAGGAEEAIAQALRRAGFQVEVHGNMAGVLWTKLLVNLNNSVNALAGVPLREELADRDYRRVLAMSIREGLSCVRAAAIRPVRFGRVDPRLLAFALTLPNAVFLRLARAMVEINADARSSMWEDLERGRPTEIEYLNGEIIRLGERFAVPVPVNRRIRELVRAAESAKHGSPRIGGGDLRKRVTGDAGRESR
jgi:2-dehydropantoate 2-reductase